MSETPPTCWTMIAQAAGGDSSERDRFARLYGPVIDAYISARWRGTARIAALDDARQEVLLECLKEGGALERVQKGRSGGFRGFLYGVVRNVALRHEVGSKGDREVTLQSTVAPPHPEKQKDALAQVFARAWALGIMRQAMELQAEQARDKGHRALERVDLLRLRFDEGLPMREIADRWDRDVERLQDDYAQARREFRRALREVVSRHMPERPEEIDGECRDLLAILKQ